MPPLPVLQGLERGAQGLDLTTHSTGLLTSVICAVGPTETKVGVPPRHLRTSLVQTAQVISGNSGLVFGALRKLRWPQSNSFLSQAWTEPDKAEWPRGGYATASPLPCVVCRARSHLLATRTDQE